MRLTSVPAINVIEGNKTKNAMHNFREDSMPVRKAARLFFGLSAVMAVLAYALANLPEPLPR